MIINQQIPMLVYHIYREKVSHSIMTKKLQAVIIRGDVKKRRPYKTAKNKGFFWCKYL